jgi:Fur family transcriptional regulator, ferric uptake regulator
LAEYETRQRRILLDYLTEHPDRGFSIEELYECLFDEYPPDRVPGKSTLYRLVAKLVAEGLVKRFSGGQGRIFAYQIVACEKCDAHLHLKCTACGGLYHMDHAASERIMNEVLSRSDFSLDEKETVLFGVCKGCKSR